MRFIVAALALVGLSLPLAVGAAPPQKGIALGLFSEDPGWSYRPLLDEIAATGANHVELVVAWYLEEGSAVAVYDHPRLTPPPFAIERAIADAHAAGLAVFLFPILRLEHPRPGEWRGTLKPRDPDALFASYTRHLLALGKLAQHAKVELLSVGSELSTLDGAGDRGRWLPLIRAVRKVYRGPLTYSGNWDHFRKVSFYDQLDLAGLCGYFALTSEGGPDKQEDLVRTWRDLRVEIERFGARLGKPMVFTEVGYLSQRGAAAWPWDEGATKPIDLEEQRRAYAAFRRVWVNAPASSLGGVYFWNWYGWGGVHSGGYTPRGKPAADEIKAFFGGSAGR